MFLKMFISSLFLNIIHSYIYLSVLDGTVTLDIELGSGYLAFSISACIYDISARFFSWGELIFLFYD